MELKDRVALVTGASRGIGAAIAAELARRGAKVVVNYNASPGPAESVVAAIRAAGGEASAVKADVSSLAEAQALVQASTDAFGRLDVLVNNAGTTRDGLLAMMKEEDWDLVLATNLKSTFNCSRTALRPMMRQKYGRIVNVTSVWGLAGNAGQTNYSASKAGIIGFTKALAKEVGSRNITVNAVAPGYVETALTEGLPEALKAAAVKATPLGRFGTCEDVAHAVAFLASENASFITGQTLGVDGGMVMQ